MKILIMVAACLSGLLAQSLSNEARAVVGLEQSGASSANPEQKLFFDFFIDRELNVSSVSLWGEVQLASYPQQITTPLAQFNLAVSLAALPVNKMVNSEAFATGLDWHPFRPWTAGAAKRRFGLIAGVGATGPFPPASRLTLFAVPNPSSPQYAAFIAQFPQAASSAYVGFLPSDRAQFYRSWFTGFRLTTTSPQNSPATYTVSIGQDEQITGGTLAGAVAKFDVFYPLPVKLNGYTCLYLFGAANMKLANTANTTPFLLAAAPSNITGSEPSVAIVPVASARDLYRIGFGVDAVGLLLRDLPRKMQLRKFFGRGEKSDVVVNAAAVIEAEREQIRARRKYATPGAPDDAPLVGVSFSGGGIRSATLHLGILQGLAHLKILPFIDYLSTVSGGGYIGTWLHGVIRRYGDGDPSRAVPYLERPDEIPHGDSQHDPITFLRKFSSYLAPDMSLFSVDFWVILIIWMRNMALNLAILVPFAAVIALALLGFGYVRQWGACWSQWPLEIVAGICAALLLAVVTVLGSGVHRVVREQNCDTPNPPWRPGADRVQSAVLCTVLLLLTAVLWACASPLLVGQRWILLLSVVLFFLFLYLQIRGGFLECYRSQHPHGKSGPALLVLFSLVSAAVTTGMFYGAMRSIATWIPDPVSLCDSANEAASWQLLAWGPPLMMIVFLAGAGLLVGLMGVDFPDFAREWLSRVGAFLAIAAIAWAGLYAVMIFGPYWMAWLTVHYGKTAVTLAAGWLLTTITGVLSGNSDKTSGQDSGVDKSTILDWLARVAPPVFMVGFLLLVATAVHAVIASLASNSCPDRSFVGGYWCALHGEHWTAVWPFPPNELAVLLLIASAAVMLFMQWRININEFSMQHFYKNRLVRCYLGASRGTSRRGSRLTGFDPCDDLPLSSLLADAPKSAKCAPKAPYYGPYPIINTSINLNTGSELAKRERKASSFIFTPLFSGYEPPRSQEEVEFSERESVPSNGYRPTCGYSSPAGPGIGTCMAISGAAANPDMGFYTSPPVAFLLTVFDVRLGYWLGNTRFDDPSAKPGPDRALLPLLSELFAQTDARSQFINLSDGGHFENLGLYELIRRRCRCIIAGDGDQDKDYTFQSLGGAIRKCRADFGVEIDIDPKRIRASTTHCVVGRIRYPDAPDGWLLYLKASMTGDEPEDVVQYQASHPDFPHETTANQFFTESQFESYRRLGLHMVESAFENASFTPERMEDLFECLYQQWYPPSDAADGVSSRHTEAYSKLMERLSADPDLKYLDPQIFCPESSETCGPAADVPPADHTIERKAYFYCLDLIQLMENVCSDLRFFEKTNRDNPQNHGWIMVFRHWSRQPVFQKTWSRARYTFNPLFQQFFDGMAQSPDPKKPAGPPCGPLAH